MNRPTDTEFLEIIRKIRTKEYYKIQDDDEFERAVHEASNFLMYWFPSSNIVNDIGKMSDEEVLAKAKANVILL